MARIEILGRSVDVACEAPGAAECLEAAYGSFARGSAAPDLRYRFSSDESGGGFLVERREGWSTRTTDLASCLRVFDEDLRVQLQILRTDLYFLHAGVVADGDHAYLIVGAPGAGKSTTCWGLSHLGFAFLSDELAPLDVENGAVLPYVRALHLKREPPDGHPLPSSTLKTAGSIHIPLDALPGGLRREAVPLGGIFFLGRRSGSSELAMRRLSAAEAASRVYANSLNALAHPAEGLDAAVGAVGRRAAFELTPGPVSATCRLIRSTVDALNLS